MPFVTMSRGWEDKVTSSMKLEIEAADDPQNAGTLESEYVTFELAGEEYGINVIDVIEVFRLVQMAQPPESADYLIGLFNLRGQVVPAIDMRIRLNLEPAAFTLATPIIITRINGCLVGLIVDRVSEVVTLSSDMVAEPPKTISNSKCVTGIAKAGSRLIFLLNLAGVFSDDEAQAIEQILATSQTAFI